MKKVYTYLFAFLLLQGCISKEERAAVDKILTIYGGNANWSIGMNTSSDDGDLQGNFFEIKLSGSDFSNFDYLSMPASNIAYLVYESLPTKEKNTYDYIRVIIDNNGKEKVFEYTREELELVDKSMPIFASTANILHTKRYDLLEQCLEKNYRSEIGGLTKFFTQVDSAYGKVNRLNIQGYSISPGKVGDKYTNLLKMSGVLVREKQNTDFSITINAKDPEKKIVDIKFQR